MAAGKMSVNGSTTTRPEETSSVRDRLLDCGLAMIAERGWRQADPAAVIVAAGVSEEDFYREFDGMVSLVVAGARRVNAAMMAARAEFEPEDTPRDKLFALLMARADAALAWRDAIVELNRAVPRDPVLAAAAGQILMQCSTLTLRTAGIEATGPVGFARASTFMLAVVLPVMRVWLADDSADSSKTMAELDRRLARAERLAQMAAPLSGGVGRPAGAA